ncbi:MAG: hypothetical protein AAGA53_16565 [Pseudomonadota bacterium]
MSGLAKDVGLGARALMGALVESIWRADQKVPLSDLTIAEFDSGLAGLYQHLYDQQVLCEARCSACGEPFEFRLDLKEFELRIWSNAKDFEGLHWEKVKAPSGRILKLPRLKDLNATDEAAQREWIKACLLKGEFDFDAIQSEIELAAPILSQDINTTCPECRANNKVRFDMARYLMDSLAAETAFLWREVHLIAKTYHWSLPDILDLTRDVRRQMVGFIVSERPRVRAVS